MYFDSKRLTVGGCFKHHFKCFHSTTYEDGYLHFFPKADVSYSLNYRYRRTVQALTADIDIPLMPVKFHMLIVWLALAYYGGSADSNSRILAMNGTTLDASGPSTRIGSMFRSLCKEQMGAVSYFGSR